ncbi:MAG: GNAT family N-acetyltransferase [Cardiobacteriaceae bacterium]|nr:GNAT family N-acetyltransferase [Cardiobacteriaceae bacterium]
MLNLTKPSLEHQEAILTFRREFLKVYDYVHGSNELNAFTDYGFRAWIHYVEAPAGTSWFGYEKVNDSTYLAWLDGKVVGIMHIRHQLSDILLQRGGNVGYSVHPDYQGRGIASEMLKYAIGKLKSLGLERILVTCSSQNAASRAVIKKNGGVLENIIDTGNTSIERYWIATT